MLPKLFWPTVRKKCSCYQEKLLNSRLKAKNLQNFEITRTIYSNSERSEQFLVTKCFFNLFLEVSNSDLNLTSNTHDTNRDRIHCPLEKMWDTFLVYVGVGCKEGQTKVIYPSTVNTCLLFWQFWHTKWGLVFSKMINNGFFSLTLNF